MSLSRALNNVRYFRFCCSLLFMVLTSLRECNLSQMRQRNRMAVDIFSRQVNELASKQVDGREDATDFLLFSSSTLFEKGWRMCTGCTSHAVRHGHLVQHGLYISYRGLFFLSLFLCPFQSALVGELCHFEFFENGRESLSVGAGTHQPYHHRTVVLQPAGTHHGVFFSVA